MKISDNTYTVGEINGFLAGNTLSVKQLYNNRKLQFSQGHGFAAELGNNLIDVLKGNNSTIVGDDNLKDGADRLIINRDNSRTWIQDKYYSSASKSVGAAFDTKTGLYRYIDSDGNPMKLEVPADQYDDAVEFMKTKIKQNKVQGITDPDEAVNLVQKGSLTYKQAVNIAKAGTLESLVYDTINGTISAAWAGGINFAIDYACNILNGIEPQVALKNAGMNGLKTGGVIFATYVISSQLIKAGAQNALVPTSEAIAKALGKDVCEAIVGKIGVSTVGKDVIRHAAQVISKELVVDGVLIVVLTGIDVIELFNGRISKEELLKNLTVTVVGVIVGTAGGYGGAALGTLIAPGLGTTIGGILGSILAGTLGTLAAEALISPYYESDAEEMYNIISDEFLLLCDEYLINMNEGSAITEKLKTKLSGDTLKDMYASKDRKQFARKLMEPLFEEQVSGRELIKVPTAADLRTEMKNALEGIVFVH